MTQQTIWGLGSLIALICIVAYIYLYLGVESKRRIFTPRIKGIMIGLGGSVLFIDIFVSEYTLTRVLATVCTAMVLSWTISKPAVAESSSSTNSVSSLR